MNTIASIIEQAEEWKLAKVDTRVAAHNVQFLGTDADQGRDMLYTKEPNLFGAEPPRMVHLRAFKQLAKILDLKSPNRLIEFNLLNDAPGFTGDMFNHFLPLAGYGHRETRTGRIIDKSVLVRDINPIYGWNDERHVRAMFGSLYQPIDLLDVMSIIDGQLETLRRAQKLDELVPVLQQTFGEEVDVRRLPDDGESIAQVVQCRITPDEFDVAIALNIEIETPEDGTYRPTIAIKGSDVRGMSLHVLPGMWKEICRNGMRRHYGRDEVKNLDYRPYIHHRGTPEALAYEIIKSVNACLGGSLQYVEKIREAAMHQMQQPDVIMQSIINAVIPKEQRANTLVNAGRGMGLGTKDNGSIMSVINGITFAAHEGDLSRDSQHMLETIGGTVLARLDSAKDKNGELRDERVEALFASISGAELIQTEDA